MPELKLQLWTKGALLASFASPSAPCKGQTVRYGGRSYLVDNVMWDFGSTPVAMLFLSELLPPLLTTPLGTAELKL